MVVYQQSRYIPYNDHANSVDTRYEDYKDRSLVPPYMDPSHSLSRIINGLLPQSVSAGVFCPRIDTVP
jgi:hypothetical protein